MERIKIFQGIEVRNLLTVPLNVECMVEVVNGKCFDEAFIFCLWQTYSQF